MPKRGRVVAPAAAARRIGRGLESFGLGVSGFWGLKFFGGCYVHTYIHAYIHTYIALRVRTLGPSGSGPRVARLGVTISLLQGSFLAAFQVLCLGFKVYGVLCKGQVGLGFGFAGCGFK